MLALQMAEAATTLNDLHRAIAGFEGCSLKRTAKNTVFADGNPDADVMLIGEAPGAEEPLTNTACVTWSKTNTAQRQWSVSFLRNPIV
ncbi:MAG: hypothetical protein ACE1ZM_03630 [Gammaproteobacteria bacterium]